MRTGKRKRSSAPERREKRNKTVSSCCACCPSNIFARPTTTVFNQRELSETMKKKIRAEYQAVGGSPDKPLQSNYFLNIIIVIAVLAILTSLLGN